MKRLNKSVGIILSAFLATNPVSAQQHPKRQIDRCAQDGLFFYAINGSFFGKNDSPGPGATINVERDGVRLQIQQLPSTNNVVLSFTRAGLTLTSKVNDFETPLGWLTVSDRAFALSLSVNASAYATRLFESSDDDLVEETSLIPAAEKIFSHDAKHVCTVPGVNTTAIKWIDNDHLLISINAWASGVCYSNFTEGFVLQLSTHTIQRKLSERQLLDLPAVCTWNLVPAPRH